jgi:hypothetical protein
MLAALPCVANNAVARPRPSFDEPLALGDTVELLCRFSLGRLTLRHQGVVKCLTLLLTPSSFASAPIEPTV